MYWKGETDGIKDGVHNCHKIMKPFQKESQQKKARNRKDSHKYFLTVIASFFVILLYLLKYN